MLIHAVATLATMAKLWNQPGYPYRILTIEQFWAKKATAVESVADGVRPEG